MKLSPAERVAGVIERAGLTQEEAAQRLEVSRYSVNQLVNGRRGITVDMALRLERVFGVAAVEWLTDQMTFDLDRARGRQRTRSDRPKVGQ